MRLNLTDDSVVAWLGQFDGNDELIARRLLQNILYVSADTFQDELSKLILSLEDNPENLVALYAERKIRTRLGVANRLFKESNTKVKRAYGAGPSPVQSQHYGRHETGSEGIVANLITQINRQRKQFFFDHPGPNIIRKKRIRRFVLVTDFIGTGNQSSIYLDAAWRLATTKSWWSGKFLRFEVVCYAATPQGIEKVENHQCCPTIRQVKACPTLSILSPYGTDEFLSLCERYGPRDSEMTIPRLGYGEIGALIAFAHGMPNNGPRMLFKSSRNWQPLFPSRVTSTVKLIDFENKKTELAKRLEILRENKISELVHRSGLHPKNGLSILILAALKKRPRTAEAASARSGLGLAETIKVLERAYKDGWIDQNNKLTPDAYRELKFLRNQTKAVTTRYVSNERFYFPNSLRAPMEKFS
ncbi:MAG: hypothetical protein HOK41_09720 [Nitrospina sp.]|jgi:hypothetical protein|nr:hypothetical protein [Nitrospina sp.]MBT6717786.1 hypothetical protein [Nitrospina sp.]